MGRPQTDLSAGGVKSNSPEPPVVAQRPAWPHREMPPSLRKKVTDVLRSNRDEILDRWQTGVIKVDEEERQRVGAGDVDLGGFLEHFFRAIEDGDLSHLYRMLGEVAKQRWRIWRLAISESGRTALYIKRVLYDVLDRELTDRAELMQAVRMIDACTTELMYHYIETYQAMAVAELQRQAGRLAKAEQDKKFAVERQHLLEKLRQQERHLAAIVDGSADAIIGLDPDGVILSWNRGAELIFGYESEEMIGRSIEVLVPDHLKRAREHETIASQVRNNGFVRGLETERLAKGGRWVVVDLTSTAIRDEQGKIVGMSAILRDITHRRRMRERVLHAERLATIGMMAARVAHDVRSPLSSITLNADLLAEELRTYAESNTTEAQALLRSIDSELERLSKVVDEYLSFARPPEAKFEPHDIAQIVGDLLDFLEKEMAGNGVRLSRAFHQGIPPMLVDAHQIRQACLNLLKNSCEAMPHGGEITAGIERQGDDVLITITDTGVGIPEDEIDTMFKPFTSTKVGGTGLGLAVAQEIVAEHGGTIRCQSRVGEGATFTIRLPFFLGRIRSKPERYDADAG